MNYITKPIERIFYFAELKGISIHKLSLEIGVSNSYFSKMKKNRASIGSDIIEKILRRYTDLNAEWLLTGNGEPVKRMTENPQHKENPGQSLACGACVQKDRVIEALNTALDAKQGEISALRQCMEDKERLIQCLMKTCAPINKQTG